MTTEEKKVTSKQDETVLAAVATIPLVGLIIYFAMPDASDFVKHYAKQSIGLLIITVANTILSFVGFALYFVFIGVFVSCLNFIIFIVTMVLWAMLLMNVFQGKKYSLPFLTDIVDQFIK